MYNKQIAKHCKIITSLPFLSVDETPNDIVDTYLTFIQDIFLLIFYFDPTYISRKNDTRFPFQI